MQSFLIVIGVLGAWFDVRNDIRETKASIARHETAILQVTGATERVALTQNLLSQNLSVLTTIVEERTKRDKAAAAHL